MGWWKLGGGMRDVSNGRHFISDSLKTSHELFKILLHFDDIFFKTAYLRLFQQLFRNISIDISQGGSLYGDGGQK